MDFKKGKNDFWCLEIISCFRPVPRLYDIALEYFSLFI
jgi:hypothetical protein